MNARFDPAAIRPPYMRGNGVLSMTPEKIAGITIVGLAALGGYYVYSRRRRRRKRRS